MAIPFEEFFQFTSYQRVAGTSGSIQIAAAFPEFSNGDVEFSHSRPDDLVVTAFLLLVAAHQDKEFCRCMEKALQAHSIPEVRETLGKLFPR